MMKRLLAMLLAVLMVLSLVGCGSTSDSIEAKNGFYKVCGVYYPEELGAPVLGEAAAEIALSEAAERITNVGDALYYIANADLSEYLSDKCSLFADLVIYDYDEIGTIRVSLNGWEESHTVVYVKDGESYYPFDPCCMEETFLLENKKLCAAADDIDSLRMRMVASFPREEGVFIESEAKSLSSLTKEEYAIVKDIVAHDYTKEQIEQWVAEGLTLDEWAEKITSPADAAQMLRTIRYRENADTAPDDNYGFWDESGVDWCGIWNAHLVFEHRNGNCGGTSTIFNYLLAGDFDEQGYVEFSSAAGGHIFNYFVLDGYYIVCDFVGIPGINFYASEESGAYYAVDVSTAILYITDDVYEFGEWYRNEGPFANNFEDPNSEDYLYSLFMYPREGTKMPKGEDENSLRTQFNIVCDILPEQYKDDYTILYEREGYPLRFAPIPDESTWPAEIR